MALMICIKMFYKLWRDYLSKTYVTVFNQFFFQFR